MALDPAVLTAHRWHISGDLNELSVALQSGMAESGTVLTIVRAGKAVVTQGCGSMTPTLPRRGMEGLQFKDGNYLAMSCEGVLVYGTTVTSNTTSTLLRDAHVRDGIRGCQSDPNDYPRTVTRSKLDHCNGTSHSPLQHHFHIQDTIKVQSHACYQQTKMR